MTQQVRVACPRVAIPEKVWKRLLAYIDACPMEVGGLGTIEWQDGKLVVTDVFLLEQAVSGVSTVIGHAAVAKFLVGWVREGKDPAILRFWWHSHADMGVFWSETDMETIRQFTQGNWLVSLVGNRRHETRTRITTNEPFPFAVDFIPVEVLADIDEAVVKAAREEVANKVRAKRRIPFFGRDKPSPQAPDDPLVALIDDDKEGR
jgi:hypothetical protein